MLRPVVEGIRKDYEGRATVRVYELDRLGDYPEGEAVRQLAPRLGVRATPTFVILDAQGEPLERFVGPTSGASLRKALDQALARHSRDSLRVAPALISSVTPAKAGVH